MAPATPPSYDEERGGSKTSKFACYAFMFDKKGCDKEKCQYSHKRRVIKEYKAEQAAKKAKEEKKNGGDKSDKSDKCKKKDGKRKGKGGK